MMERRISIGDSPRHFDVERGLDEKGVDVLRVTTPISHGDGDGEGDEVIQDVRIRRRTTTRGTQISQAVKKTPGLNWLLRKSNEGVEIDRAPPPDGGLLAWTIVALATSVGFNTFGFLNACGVLQTHYTETLNLPPSSISWIGSIQAFLQLFMSAFSGRLTDAGYFHQILFIGTAIQLAGVFAAASATTYWQILLSHGVCVGLGGGLILCPSFSLVGTYFAKRRALALSICAIGNSAGGLVFAAILQNMIARAGFAWAMRTCGFVMASTLIPANFLLRPRAIERRPAALFEWSAFGEPAYGLFAAGMFLSFVGQWVPVFYVSVFFSCASRVQVTLLKVVGD